MIKPTHLADHRVASSIRHDVDVVLILISLGNPLDASVGCVLLHGCSDQRSTKILNDYKYNTIINFITCTHCTAMKVHRESFR